jgi:hypothetical protein
MEMATRIQVAQISAQNAFGIASMSAQQAAANEIAQSLGDGALPIPTIQA